MKNGRRSEARASAASYNKRQPRHCSRSASRRLARGCPQRKPKRKPSTKTKNQNENLKRKPQTKTVLVLVLVLVLVCSSRFVSGARADRARGRRGRLPASTARRWRRRAGCR